MKELIEARIKEIQGTRREYGTIISTDSTQALNHAHRFRDILEIEFLHELLDNL